VKGQNGLLVVILLAASACSSTDGFSENDGIHEFAGTGTLKASVTPLHYRPLRHAFIEMIELTGPPSERCGPGDCGLAVEALRAGTPWNPGRWRIIPPDVKGCRTPAPIEVTITEDRTTDFELRYHC
jgi:hypothetical protein